MRVDTWGEWQQEVMAVIRTDLATVLEDVGSDEIDWDAWRPYFDAGRSPRDAVDDAFGHEATSVPF